MLSSAASVTVLDRFMRERVLAKLPSVRNRLHVLPPWSLESVQVPLLHVDNPFRRSHGLQDKFVVMYSGNHSLANPLDTLMEAAARLAHRDGLMFVFVGGGVGKRQIDASTLRNVRSLPYQPLATLRQSLSAADVHVVSIGDGVVGIVHPCKVYGAMAVARPILLFGPPENHVADLLRRDEFGWHLHHGDVDGTVDAIEHMLAMRENDLRAMGLRAQQALAADLGREGLTQSTCDIFEGRESVRA
jgi:colanic acid biosynthesis glycosyl transferase WcaI